MDKKILRKSNIEVLRIISMFFIVLSHWGGHGSWTLDTNGDLFINKVFMQIIQYFGEIGNCLFVLITGYFCIERTSFSFKGIKRIVIDIKFYAFVVWLVVVLTNIENFTMGGLIKAFFPIIYNQYWFIGAYLIVFFFSPVINMVIRNFDKNQIKIYFLFFVLTQLIFPVFKCQYFISNIGIFILYYSVGALIRMGYFSRLRDSYNSYYCLLASMILAILITITSDILAYKDIISIENSMSLVGRFSVFPITGAVGIFCILLKNDFTNNYVNKIAQSVFAIYIISENPNIYPWLWKRYFDNMNYYNSIDLIPMAIIDTLIVMVVCFLIDIIYKYLNRVATRVFKIGDL